MTDALPPPVRLLFRPDAFFVKPWRGWGVVRDRKGATVSRFQASGEGSVGSRIAHTRQTLTFSDGTTRSTQWEIETDDEAHFFARDPSTGMEGRGRQIGDDFRWLIVSPIKGGLGLVQAHTRVTYTLVTPVAAMSFAETRVCGFLVSTIVSFYEQI